MGRLDLPDKARDEDDYHLDSIFPELSPDILERVEAVRKLRVPGNGQQLAPIAPIAPRDPDDLTERELQVLTLIAAGDSNAEIGAKLYLGKQTVMTYVKRLLDKLEARNRTHAVTCGFLTGLLPATPTEGTTCGN
jgi:DNA-binding NarL/FixJ family response regulator